jgi:hypothetical protein
MHGLLDVVVGHTLWIPCREEHIEQLLSIAFRVLGELFKIIIMSAVKQAFAKISGHEHQDCNAHTMISTLDRPARCEPSVSTYKQVTFPASSHSTISRPGEAMRRESLRK